MKRLLASFLQALGATAATAGIMFLLMCVLNWIWVLNGNLEHGQTLRGYYSHCMAMSLAMIGAQAVTLFVANNVVAFHRGRLGIVLALVSGALLILLDCVAPSAGVLPHNTVGWLAYFLAFPLLVTAVQWLPDWRTRKTSNQGMNTDQ